MIGAMRHALVFTAVLALAAAASAETHKFKPTAGVTTFAVRPPALTIKPGDTVERSTPATSVSGLSAGTSSRPRRSRSQVITTTRRLPGPGRAKSVLF